MALLDNRVKIDKSTIQGVLSLSNIITLIFLLLLAFILSNGSIHRMNLELSGVLGERILNPAKEYINKLSRFYTNIGNFQILHQENLRLRLEIEEFKSIKARLTLLELENTNLEEHIVSSSINSYTHSLVTKLLYCINTPNNELAIVNGGENDGVNVNDIVLQDSFLFGRVIEVSDHFAKVLLLSNIHSRIPVVISGDSSHAIASGFGKQAVKLTHLSDEYKANEDDIVITSGSGKYFPAGIPVARINTIQDNKIEASLFSDYSNAKFVTILQMSNMANN